MPKPLSDATRILGERVREQRLKYALSQDDVANLAGMNVSNLGKIERGLSNPTFHTIVRIASVLGIDPAMLIKGITKESLPEPDSTFTAREFLKEKRHRES